MHALACVAQLKMPEDTPVPARWSMIEGVPNHLDIIPKTTYRNHSPDFKITFSIQGYAFLLILQMKRDAQYAKFQDGQLFQDIPHRIGISNQQYFPICLLNKF